jgi:hypothetical protein
MQITKPGSEEAITTDPTDIEKVIQYMTTYVSKHEDLNSSGHIRKLKL